MKVRRKLTIPQEDIISHPLGFRGVLADRISPRAEVYAAWPHGYLTTVLYDIEAAPRTVLSRRASRITNMKPRYQRTIPLKETP